MTECYVNHFGVFSDSSAAVMEGSTDAQWCTMWVTNRRWVRTESDQQWEWTLLLYKCNARNIWGGRVGLDGRRHWEGRPSIIGIFQTGQQQPRENVEYLWGAPCSHDNTERSRHYIYVELGIKRGNRLWIGQTGNRTDTEGKSSVTCKAQGKIEITSKRL